MPDVALLTAYCECQHDPTSQCTKSAMNLLPNRNTQWFVPTVTRTQGEQGDTTGGVYGVKSQSTYTHARR